MSKRERLSGIWLISMTLMSWFAYTVYSVDLMWSEMLKPFYFILLIAMQSAALIIYMWGPEKIKSGLLKVLYRLLYASSLAVLPLFLFIFIAINSQYHADIPEAVDASAMLAEDLLPGDKTVIYNTGSLYVFFPEFSEVDFIAETPASKSDGTVTMSISAAAQHKRRLDFTHENIEGDHAVEGVYYESPYNRNSFAAFTFADGQFNFEFDHPAEAVKKAAEAGGSGFMHYGLIRNGERLLNIRFPRGRCFRTLAELNGHVCVIDSAKIMAFDDFLDEVLKLGVQSALYVDMGAGWNYSWYRTVEGKARNLFGFSLPWSHNWVVFRK